MTHDVVNALFECGGGLLLIINVARLIRDKKISGVSVWPTAWWTLWGIWNLFYYPVLAQWASFAAGILVVLANAAWVGLAVWYGRRKVQ